MPLSHLKFYMLDNNLKEELNESLQTELVGSIASKTITIGPSGFEEIEAQQIAVDIWGCSTPNTEFAPTNLDLQKYSFTFMNLTLYNCSE